MEPWFLEELSQGPKFDLERRILDKVASAGALP